MKIELYTYFSVKQKMSNAKHLDEKNEGEFSASENSRISVLKSPEKKRPRKSSLTTDSVKYKVTDFRHCFI